jgi:gliding motility-associated-like protein
VALVLQIICSFDAYSLHLMKNFFLTLFFFFNLISFSFATHQRAANITYKHISDLTWEFTVTMYTKTSSVADDTRTTMPIFWGDNTGDEIPRIYFAPIPDVFDITLNIYKGTHTFPAPGSYVISVEDPNRNGGVVNIPNSINVPMFVETELVINPFLGYNNSVQLLNPPIDQGCVGKLFIHNPAAYDIDGDSLSFQLVVCKGAGGYDIPGYTYPKTSDIFEIDSVTGSLVWRTPILQGEYNVAFVVTEWRFGNKVGSVRRDMQINIVACDHVPPELLGISDTCVLAGEFLTFDIKAFDPDGTQVTLTAFGGPFELSYNPAEIDPDPAFGYDTVSTTFSWPTACAHVRFEPYTVVFKAQDDGFPVNLVNFKTVNIKVIAPAPENLQTEALGNGINLSWEKSTCENAVGYKIYRRSGESGWVPGVCETGVPNYTGFKLIKTVAGIDNLSFRDENEGLDLIHGINYCYRLTAYFIDEAESYASNEACAFLKRDVPIITHVSNDSLNLLSGNAIVAWSKPTELDTIQYPGPYKYLLYRNEGVVWTAPTFVAEFNNWNDTIYLDQSVNLNTTDKPYSYKIDFESQTIGPIGSTQKASSVFLRIEPRDKELRLVWAAVVPWQNEKFVIYRKSPGEEVFDSLTTTAENSYRDIGLVNFEEYCYYIKAIGHYSLPGLVDPLVNFSQIACGEPSDNQPPCQPELTVETNCEEVSNTLQIVVPYDSCNYDVRIIYIYYSPSNGQQLQLIDSVAYNPNDTTLYIDEGLNTVVGCYAVTAIDTVGNISVFSETVCVNFDACPTYELPNVFTPNGDGYNDFFVPLDDGSNNPKSTVDHIDLTIINRWGKIMFTTTDPAINWDGKYQNNGKPCGDGVYFYTCEVFYITLDGLQQSTLKGSVTIFGAQ